jgi:hypothetical protein
MIQLFGKRNAGADDYEARYRALRRTMQDILIAHAAVAYKHMTPEQFAAVQDEWGQLIKGRNWGVLFADDAIGPGERWTANE